jgi:hypothetical protein
MIVIAIGFTAVFFFLLFAAKKLFKAEVKGDWALFAIAAFPFLVYAVLSILQTELLRKEISLSIGIVNVKLIDESGPGAHLDLAFDHSIEADASSAVKRASTDIKTIIEDARRRKLTTLLVDTKRYKVSLPVVDRYASKSGYLFKHVVFVAGPRFLGNAAPMDIDWYISSDKFEKNRDIYEHLRIMPVRTDAVYDTTIERQALDIMKKRGLDTIAVLDSRTGNYKGLTSRQQITERMLVQIEAEFEESKAPEAKKTEEDIAVVVKSLQKEIRELSNLQSQQMGLLQGLAVGAQRKSSMTDDQGSPVPIFGPTGAAPQEQQSQPQMQYQQQ